ncbi:hypothetical protein [Dietzia sp. 179-F 9C3 NHS]|uniref:hypothetical protein n=1 Tax=Dietzia sp. 179-F 9C3 NHS TaxID=3374295 RepID=UPI0038798B28
MTSTIDGSGTTTREVSHARPPGAGPGAAASGVAAPPRPPRTAGPRRGRPARSVRGRRVEAAPAARLSAAEVAQRVPFVVVILVLIGAGVGGTLLLSAQSTQDTYDLKNARDANVELVERMEALRASNERARSAEVLATRAEKLGMVGVASAPILTRGSDGHIEVVGEPEATLGAPIKPLQPAPVASDPSEPPARDGFDAPPAQAPQDRAPRGVAPVPYPPLAGPPTPVAPSAPPAEPVPPADGPATAPEAAAAPAHDPATLAPVPGQFH